MHQTSVRTMDRLQGGTDLGAKDWGPTCGGEYPDELGQSLRTRRWSSEVKSGVFFLRWVFNQLKKMVGANHVFVFK